MKTQTTAVIPKLFIGMGRAQKKLDGIEKELSNLADETLVGMSNGELHLTKKYFKRLLILMKTPIK